jgi:hypothetical protein
MLAKFLLFDSLLGAKALFELAFITLTTLLFGTDLTDDATISAEFELLFERLLIVSTLFEWLSEHEEDEVAEMAVEIVVDLLLGALSFKQLSWLLLFNDATSIAWLVLSVSSLNEVCNELFVFELFMLPFAFWLWFKLFFILISTSISLPFNSFNFSSTFFKAIACSFSSFYFFISRLI